MASKRASLFGSTNAAPQVAVTPMVENSTPKKADRPTSRQGKKIVSAFVSEEASIQLRMLAVTERSTVQALMVEALNDLFSKRGANRVAE